MVGLTITTTVVVVGCEGVDCNWCQTDDDDDRCGDYGAPTRNTREILMNENM